MLREALFPITKIWSSVLFPVQSCKQLPADSLTAEKAVFEPRISKGAVVVVKLIPTVEGRRTPTTFTGTPVVIGTRVLTASELRVKEFCIEVPRIVRELVLIVAVEVCPVTEIDEAFICVACARFVDILEKKEDGEKSVETFIVLVSILAELTVPGTNIVDVVM